MGRRKNRSIKNISIIGKTINGKYVVDNMYWFKNTYGISLSEILICLHDNNMIIDWYSYITNAILFNNKHILSDIRENLVDSCLYNSKEITEIINKCIKIIENNKISIKLRKTNRKYITEKL